MQAGLKLLWTHFLQQKVYMFGLKYYQRPKQNIVYIILIAEVLKLRVDVHRCQGVCMHVYDTGEMQIGV